MTAIACLFAQVQQRRRCLHEQYGRGRQSSVPASNCTCAGLPHSAIGFWFSVWGVSLERVVVEVVRQALVHHGLAVEVAGVRLCVCRVGSPVP